MTVGAEVTPEGTLTYAYDNLGRKTSTSVKGPGEAEPSRTTTYTYDSLGRLETVTEQDLTTGVLAPIGHAYRYDLVGNLDSELSENGVFTDYVYDLQNRLEELTHYRTNGTDADLANLSDNTVIASFDYHLREDGRRTGRDRNV